MKKIKEYIMTAVITLIVTNAFLFFITPSRISGHSMEPTLHDKSFVMVLKYRFSNSKPERNDLVVIDFRHSDIVSEKYLVKRVIGVDGDIIKFKDNKIYVNEIELEETYIKNSDSKLEDFEYKVPNGYIYVLGDNRDHSYDSRNFGFVNYKDMVIGRILFQLF